MANALYIYIFGLENKTHVIFKVEPRAVQKILIYKAYEAFEVQETVIIQLKLGTYNEIRSLRSFTVEAELFNTELNI